LLQQLFSDFKRSNRPREIEVLLSIFNGADFFGISPYSTVQNGKETLQIVGFANHDWLKRQPN
jgi:hypothetical protein